jgi:putative chitinase
MKHLKSIEEFKAVNEQLFGNYSKKLSNLLFGDPDAAKVGESPVGGSITNIPASGDKGKNIQALIEAMKRHGITNPYTQKAILGVIGKESGFLPKNEFSYSGTSASRIKNIFKTKLGNLSDQEVDRLKASDEAFFNKVYGGRYGNSENEGYKYRGRGFNGITFKGVYKKMQGLLDKIGKLGRRVDIVSNPDLLNDIDVAAECAVLYFLDRATDPMMAQKYGVKDINGFKDQETALKAMVNANAGWGSNIENDFLNNLAKAREHASQFNINSSGVSNIA